MAKSGQVYAFNCRVPAKSRFHCPMTHVVARPHATALVQAGSQIPATGTYGHLVQTATLPGPWGGRAGGGRRRDWWAPPG